MHNLGTVFQFEVIRTLKKKSFWIMALGFPLLLGVIAGIIYFSNKTTSDVASQLEKQSFSIATNGSDLVEPQIIAGLNAAVIEDKQTGIDSVKQGTIDAYFYYPTDLTSGKVEVYGRDVGVFDNSRYQAVASALLSQSVATRIDPQATAVLQSQVGYTVTTYRDGVPYDSFKHMIIPGVFLVLFYLLIAFFGNQMLTSTTEEKENRVIEMILTTIQARTLIIGKIISLIVLAAIQIVIILIPVISAYLLFGDKLSLPSIDLSGIPLDPMRIAIGATLFVSSFLLFTGLLVAVGAAAPTAKEAGGFLGLVMMFIFGPLYAAPLFISAPDSPLVQFLGYFPFTAPIPSLLRNAVGNLSLGEAMITIGIVSITAALVLGLAIRIFRYGALEYSRRLNLREIFRRRA